MLRVIAAALLGEIWGSLHGATPHVVPMSPFGGSPPPNEVWRCPLVASITDRRLRRRGAIAEEDAPDLLPGDPLIIGPIAHAAVGKRRFLRRRRGHRDAGKLRRRERQMGAATQLCGQCEREMSGWWATLDSNQ